MTAVHRSAFLRRATSGDVGRILDILISGREAQRRMGFVQWDDDFPQRCVVENDIKTGQGYIFEIEGEAAGYVAVLDFDSEYLRLSHIWSCDEPYCVAHRLAIADEFRGRGISALLFDAFEQLAISRGALWMRIDTGTENVPMQSILRRRAYASLGCQSFVWGPRLAYEKRLVHK